MINTEFFRIHNLALALTLIHTHTHKQLHAWNTKRIIQSQVHPNYVTDYIASVVYYLFIIALKKTAA